MTIMRMLLLAMLLCLVPGCVDEPPAPRPLRVGWYRWPGWYPMAIAQERDLFSRHGARIEPVLYDNYTDLLIDLASGRLDACFGGLYEVLRAGIADIKVTLATDFSNGAEGFVVVPEIREPTDLRGKRIGIQGGASGSEFVLTVLLRQNGVTPRDVSFVDVEPESILGEMPDNIQGGYTWEPYLGKALQAGYRLLFSTADLPGMVVDVFAVSGRAARERGADLRGFHAAWFEALDWWTAHPEEGARLVANVIKEDVSSSEPEGCMVLGVEENRNAFRPGNTFLSLYFTGRKQIEFFMDIGGVSAIPDLSTILDDTFLPAQEARP